MNRSTIFSAAAAVAVICLIVALLYTVGGTPLGHHGKHAILFFGLAVLAALFAAANRPLRARL
jgi:1,4-dihydroxy-2-naphthoate octaprenyltransferase